MEVCTQRSEAKRKQIFIAGAVSMAIKWMNRPVNVFNCADVLINSANSMIMADSV